MIFSSVTFLFLFLPFTLLFYYIAPTKLKNAVLVFFSLIFYAWGEPVYVLLMLYSILLNYTMGLLLERCPAWKKQVLVFTVILNLLILGFFKYYGFVMENINAITHLNLPIRKLSLPIGISFYTFQALSYIIDLYRGKFKVQKNIINFAAYISMFPQLIAGPIVRYEDVQAQMEQKRISLAHFGRGSARFVTGLAKKVILANLIGAVFDSIHGMGAEISTVTAWLGALAYTFQIYFDFSGYSDMAIGLGEMLGFRFMENFNHPYIAKNITDFWRRWHISLSTWFREYVYIPLGGNRVSTIKHIRNILIVWALTGLWHGASWNFVIWGLYYGLLLLFEKYVLSKVKWPAVLSHFVTCILVIVGWVIFSSDTVSEIGNTLLTMIGIRGTGLLDTTALYYLKSNAVLLVLELFFCLPFASRFVNDVALKKMPLRVGYAIWIIVIFLISLALMVSESYNPFLYFRF